MTRNKFLKQLNNQLQFFPTEERENAVLYYMEFLDESENIAETLESLPKPKEIAYKLREELGITVNLPYDTQDGLLKRYSLVKETDGKTILLQLLFLAFLSFFYFTTLNLLSAFGLPFKVIDEDTGVFIVENVPTFLSLPVIVFAFLTIGTKKGHFSILRAFNFEALLLLVLSLLALRLLILPQLWDLLPFTFEMEQRIYEQGYRSPLDKFYTAVVMNLLLNFHPLDMFFYFVFCIMIPFHVIGATIQRKKSKFWLKVPKGAL